jgi:hypothetical protein
MQDGSETHYRRFTAPHEDRGFLIEPPLEEVGRLVEENVARRTQDYRIGGRPLADLSRQAREELLAEARRWTSAYRPVDWASKNSDGLIFLAGHQPELFHPGVWFKNFALGALAQQHGATAVNLVIDSDTVKGTSLPVPGGSPGEPRVESIPFDAAGLQVPFEERKILDRRTFDAFGGRVAQRIGPLVGDLLIQKFWPMVVQRAAQTDRLGYCVAQARHQLEGQWGVRTLEVPQSRVCEGEAFRWFIAHLIAELPRFREAYNAAVHEYRQVHGIRNAAHPVPDLAADGPWLETPLWFWTAQQPERRRLMACYSSREVTLSDRVGLDMRVPLSPPGTTGRIAERLADWQRQGVKIRSRALLTTLWARLALGDLFVHGIGGAKYDQVTDELIRRFFHREPPDIMVLSATLLLPITRPAVDRDRPKTLRRQLRELTFHPEKFLESSPAARPLIAEKWRWIETPQTPENAYLRWSSLRRINESLQPLVAERRQAVLDLQSQTAQRMRKEKVLGRRDYAFCFYPEKNLREFFDQLLHKMT